MRGDVYERVNGTWVKRDNVRGPANSDVGYIPVYDSAAQLIHDESTLALFAGADLTHPWKNSIGGADGLSVYRGSVRAATGGDGNIAIGIPGPSGKPPGGFALLPSIGVNTSVTLASAAGAWEPSGAITVAMWVYLLSYPTSTYEGCLLNKGASPTDDTPIFRVSVTAEQLKVAFKAATSGPYTVTLDARALLPLHTWALLSIAYDPIYYPGAPNPGRLVVCINGELAVTAGGNGALAWSTGSDASRWTLGIPYAWSAVACDVLHGPLWIEAAARSMAYEQARYQAFARRF